MAPGEQQDGDVLLNPGSRSSGGPWRERRPFLPKKEHLPPEFASRAAYLEAWVAPSGAPRPRGTVAEALRSALLLSVSAAHLFRTGRMGALALLAERHGRAARLVEARAAAGRAPRLEDALELGTLLQGKAGRAAFPIREKPSRLDDPAVPPPERLPEALAALGRRLDALAARRPVALRAACEAHLAFEEAHPFEDANGRAGLLLLAWHLLLAERDSAGLGAPRWRLADREPYLAAVRDRDVEALARLAGGSP